MGSLNGSVKRMVESSAKLEFWLFLASSTIGVAIDRENSGGVFHHHLPALVEAEHARDVAVLLGAVPDFWLVDLMGKIIPYHAGKLDANTDIHLVVFQRNTVLRTPFGKKAAAHTAHGKDDMRPP